MIVIKIRNVDIFHVENRWLLCQKSKHICPMSTSVTGDNFRGILNKSRSLEAEKGDNTLSVRMSQGIRLPDNGTYADA